MEFGDEFQTWDYLNHLYDVPAPPTEQGYISFIPLSTGGYTVNASGSPKTQSDAANVTTKNSAR